MNKKTIFLSIAVVACIAAGAAWYLAQKPVERSLTKEADIVVSASDLLAAFAADESAAMTRFAAEGTVVQVNGTVRSIDRSEPSKVAVILETGDPLAGVVCEFEPAFAPDWKDGMDVKVKGACTGFLMDVVVNRCAVVE